MKDPTERKGKPTAKKPKKPKNRHRREPEHRCCQCKRGIWPDRIAYGVSHNRTDLLACGVYCQRKWLRLHPKTVYEPEPYPKKKPMR